jgi:hypothetical protein
MEYEGLALALGGISHSPCLSPLRFDRISLYSLTYSHWTYGLLSQPRLARLMRCVTGHKTSQIFLCGYEQDHTRTRWGISNMSQCHSSLFDWGDVPIVEVGVRSGRRRHRALGNINQQCRTTHDENSSLVSFVCGMERSRAPGTEQR